MRSCFYRVETDLLERVGLHVTAKSRMSGKRSALSRGFFSILWRSIHAWAVRNLARPQMLARSLGQSPCILRIFLYFTS